MMDKYVTEQFVGKTLDDRLHDEIHKYWTERKFTALGFVPRPGFIASVMNIKDKEILGLGGSDPLDVANNNFGKFIAAMCSQVSSATNASFHRMGFEGGGELVKDDGTTNGTPYFYNRGSSDAYYNSSNQGRTFLEMGAGTTTPLQSDFNIETALPSAPMNVRAGTGIAGYISGSGLIKINLLFGPAVDAATVNEIALFMFMNWIQTGVISGQDFFMLSHDAIGPGVSYVAGDTLLAEYVITI